MRGVFDCGVLGCHNPNGSIMANFSKISQRLNEGTEAKEVVNNLTSTIFRSKIC